MDNFLTTFNIILVARLSPYRQARYVNFLRLVRIPMIWLVDIQIQTQSPSSEIFFTGPTKCVPKNTLLLITT